MAKGPEGVLISKILERHGSRPDLRLWRNETAGTWVGKLKARTKIGEIVLHPGASRIMAGLCKHSADLVGLTGHRWELGPAGLFLAIEVKTKNTAVDPGQQAWIDLIRSFGGIAGIVWTVEEVDELIGQPPERK